MGLAIINKDRSRDLDLALNGTAFSHPVREMSLVAPNVESTSGITLGGQTVSSKGVWSRGFAPASTSVKLLVPRTSALLCEFEGVHL